MVAICIGARIDRGREAAMLAGMIFPNEPQYAADVGGHYDELDETYRTIWGEHVHHGYWRTGRETPEQATEALVGLVAERLELSPGRRSSTSAAAMARPPR